MSWSTDKYDENEEFGLPLPWGEAKRMYLGAFADAIKIVYPGDGEFTGFKPRARAATTSRGKKGKRGTKRAGADRAGEEGEGGSEDDEGEGSEPSTTRRKRAPQTCKKCGQLRKGHTCTA